MEKKSKFTKEFIKYYNEDSDKGCILIVDVEYPQKVHDLHSDLPFLSERMKLNEFTKLVCNSYDKENYTLHIRALKQVLNHGLKIKKVHEVNGFYQ